jgi:hypothetical protein
LGGPDTYPHYPAGWALAMNTPYPWTKQVASHYGGTRNGMIAPLAQWDSGARRAAAPMAPLRGCHTHHPGGSGSRLVPVGQRHRPAAHGRHIDVAHIR